MRMAMECGWPGYLILFVGAAGIGVSLAAAVTAAMSAKFGTWSAGAALAVVGLILALGSGGTALGHMQTEKALAAVNPDQASLILHQGYLESRECTELSLGMGVLPGIFALLATGFALGRGGKVRWPLAVGAILALVALAGAVATVVAPLPGKAMDPDR